MRRAPQAGQRVWVRHPIPLRWGIFSWGKTIILQKIDHQTSCLGVCCANNPPKKGGGGTTPVPALHLATSFRSDLNKLSCATKQPILCENGQVLTRKRPYGGGGGSWGYLQLGPGTPAMG